MKVQTLEKWPRKDVIVRPSTSPLNRASPASEAPSKEQQAAIDIATAHAQRASQATGDGSGGASHAIPGVPLPSQAPLVMPAAMPALPAVPVPAKSLLPWAPKPVPQGETAVEIGQNVRHRAALTAHNKGLVYGVWGLAFLAHAIVAGVSAGGVALDSNASRVLTLSRSVFSLYDLYSADSDFRYAKRDYKKAHSLHNKALASWRTMAEQVDGQPLDELSEQLLAASRHMVGLLADMLSGFESAYLPTAAANRLKAQRELSLTAEDQWLARRRLPDTVDNHDKRATLQEAMDKTLAHLDTLPKPIAMLDTKRPSKPRINRRDYQAMQRKRRADARKIRKIEKEGATHPDHAQLDTLQKEQAKQQGELQRLKAFFSKGKGPALFLPPGDLGLKELARLRDDTLTRANQPLIVGSMIAGLMAQYLPMATEALAQGVGFGSGVLSVLLTPLNLWFSALDAEVAKREVLNAASASRIDHKGLQYAVALRCSLKGVSHQASIGHFVIDNQISALHHDIKRQLASKMYGAIRGLKAQIMFLGVTPVVGVVLGGAALGLFIAGNLATGGIVGAAGLVLAGAVLGPYFLTVRWRLQQAKKDKNEDKKNQRIEQHLREVLGPDYTRWIYTLSGPEFDRRMQAVKSSAPEKLRKGLEPNALLKHNHAVSTEWFSRELLHAAQRARDEGTPVPATYASQLLVRMGMSETEVQFLQTCLPLCSSDEHYLTVCRATIASKIYKIKVYRPDRLPHHKPAASLQDTEQVLVSLLGDPEHAGLLQELLAASSRDALNPSGALTTQGRLLREEQLAKLRSALLIQGVSVDDLKRFRSDRPTHGLNLPHQPLKGYKLQWLLDVLIDPSQHVQAPRPVQPLTQVPELTAPLLGYEVLAGAIQQVGHEKVKSSVVRWLEGPDYRTPNPMGTAGQFLKERDRNPELTDDVLDALKAWKLRELQKLNGKPTVPPGYHSLDNWLLDALEGTIAQCQKVSAGVQTLNAEGEKRGRKLQRRHNDLAVAARQCKQRLAQRMRERGQPAPRADRSQGVTADRSLLLIPV